MCLVVEWFLILGVVVFCWLCVKILLCRLVVMWLVFVKSMFVEIVFFFG